MNKSNLSRVFIASGILLLGAMEYVLNRPMDATYLGTTLTALTGGIPLHVNIFGIFSGVVPDFAHPLSFALFTMALFPAAGRKIRGLMCLFWLAVNVFFEIGQFFGTKTVLFMSKMIPAGGLLNLLSNYFTAGTYDPMDILAIGLGITAAFIIGEITANRGGMENVSKDQNQKKVKQLTTVLQNRVAKTGSEILCPGAGHAIRA